MRKLTPKGIIGLTTTAFLFLILTSLIYFNDQVEFNEVKAKWELQDDYKIGSVITYTSISLKSYDIQFIENERWRYFETDPTIQADNGWSRTDKIPIINDSLFIHNPEYVTAIIFWDNNTYLGGYAPSNLTESWVISNDDWSNDGIITLPNNATHFAMVGLKVNIAIFTYENIPYASFITTDPSYEQEVVISEPPLDSYQVFENIRNNATTINPLGFMNSIVSVPARAVGYYNSFVDFVTGGLGLNFRDQTFAELGDNWWVKLDIFISKFNNPEIFGDPWDRWRD